MKDRSHLTAEFLAAYVDGGLSQAERDKANYHLAQCRECLAWLANVVRTIGALKAAPCAAVVAFTVALLAVAVPVDAQRASIVYTNIVNGQRIDAIVKAVRVVTPAAPVPSSIVTTEVLPRSYRAPLGATSYVPPARVAAAPSIPAPKPQPWFVNGVYVGASPSGNWTSISIGRPVVEVRIISPIRRTTSSSAKEHR